MSVRIVVLYESFRPPYAQGQGRWTIRDLDNKVLREFFNDGGTWTVKRDYVHRDGALLAAVLPNGQVNHFHPDHLGTPRLITRNDGWGPYQVAFHAYYPYGVEATAFNQDDERLKFTGHERDLGVSWSAADDVDYMHARYYNPQVGRFLSVDPLSFRSRYLKGPQYFNGYAYVLGNPVGATDPDGREPKVLMEFKSYIIKMYTHDEYHGGKHYHVEKKSGALLARVSTDGKVLTGHAPNSVLKHMIKKGLIQTGAAVGKKALGVLGALVFADQLNASEFSATEIAEQRMAREEMARLRASGMTDQHFWELVMAHPGPPDEKEEEEKDDDEEDDDGEGGHCTKTRPDCAD